MKKKEQLRDDGTYHGADHHMWDYCVSLGPWVSPDGVAYDLGILVERRSISLACVYGTEDHQYKSGELRWSPSDLFQEVWKRTAAAWLGTPEIHGVILLPRWYEMTREITMKGYARSVAAVERDQLARQAIDVASPDDRDEWKRDGFPYDFAARLLTPEAGDETPQEFRAMVRSLVDCADSLLAD